MSFQSYLSPVLTSLTGIYKSLSFYFQSYLSPVLTILAKLFIKFILDFQSYLSPVLTIWKVLNNIKKEYTFNPTLVQF